jgi:uncharacterized protein
MSTHQYTNRLIDETSPYLLQHAHNPVDWYAWNEEAFEKAKAENKPILVSIGYSTCHWCHVMERESFENEEVAAYMNAHFINIKVDREERPDVDQIYMDAVQALTRSGGWPLNCFLTPDKKPFFGGTYFPPRQAHNRPSWIQVLQYIDGIFHNERQTVEEQANKLISYIERDNQNFIGNIQGIELEKTFTPSFLENTYYQLRDRFDRLEGGFGHAPKFPGTMGIHFCLNYHFHTGNEEAKTHALFSLDKMIQGGIYDQIGGGFARYATDRAWLIPHFEKMLYDNALLVGVVAEAFQITKSDIYKETIEETLTFIEREMTSPEGGFYSAQDADSEGVEGKYYVWDKSEIDAILGEDAEMFNAFYDVSEAGNWEHANILWRAQNYEGFAMENGLDLRFFKNKMRECREKLFAVRDKRIKPGLDDKILLDWNALMATAYAKAYAALGNFEYKEAAERNISFILENFRKTEQEFYHTYKEGKRQYDAFLNDYAYLIEALLAVYAITFKDKYLLLAGDLTAYTIENFYDKDNHLFYFTSEQQNDIIVRRKDLYDSAVPSGNSTMVHNLQRIGILLDKENYTQLAQDMLSSIAESIEKYPTSFGRWASAAINLVHPIKEVAILGDDALDLAKTANSWFVPNIVIMATKENKANFPLLADKNVLPNTKIYVCQNYACQLPVDTLEQAKELILGF